MLGNDIENLPFASPDENLPVTKKVIYMSQNNVFNMTFSEIHSQNVNYIIFHERVSRKFLLFYFSKSTYKFCKKKRRNLHLVLIILTI